jgi:EF-P beta-lysylation protein EpmB
MITRLTADRQACAWQTALAQAITDPEVLIRRLGLDAGLLPTARMAAQQFRLKVPESYVARMQSGNPNDPLLRQVLPMESELQQAPGFVEDPVGDLDAMAAPGVIQKYAGRALLIATGACAIHCRYCFRRHYPYGQASARRNRWPHTLAWLRARPDIREIILSGGDPLMLTDGELAAMARDLARIDHLRTLRLHTRLPVILPERIGADLIQWIADTRLRVVMVIHANHAQELDPSTRNAFAALAQAGVRMFNQAVLLRGVNDNVAALRDLGEALFNSGVQPYYLHMLDPVCGATHFAVEDVVAVELMQALAADQPGYLLPRLVREIPGAAGKSPVI